MKIKPILLPLCAFLVVLISCKKEPVDLTGSWKFINAKIDTKLTTKYTQSGVSYLEIGSTSFTTVNNAGVFVFSGGNKIARQGLSYTVPDTAHYFDNTYQNGVLQKSTAALLGANQYGNGTGTDSISYSMIGADSISVPQGLIPVIPQGGCDVQNTHSQVSTQGNTLTITLPMNTDQGATHGPGSDVTNQVNVVFTLQKQ